MGNKDREFTTQPLTNNNQLQAQSNPNKWVVNLSSIPLSKAQESLLSKGPNYAIAPKSPHLEYITSTESDCKKLITRKQKNLEVLMHPNQTLLKKN